MKKEGKKLRLGKINIQRLATPMDRDEQKKVNAGSGEKVLGTYVPIFCVP